MFWYLNNWIQSLRKSDHIKRVRKYKIGKNIEVTVYRGFKKFLPADDPRGN